MLRRWDLPLGLDGHEPLATGFADSDVLRFTKHLLRLAVAHPAHLRDFDTSVLVVYLEALRNSVTLTLTFLLELRKVSSFLKEVCVRSFQVLQRLLQRLRWYVGQELVLHLPVWQESAQASVAQSLFLLLVAFDVESQTLVVDEAARTSELPQVAELFAARLKFEFERLQSQHVVGVLALR